jgi:hypothetical protein
MKHAIMSITLAGIESQGTFCYLESGQKKWVHDVFHLYERVVFAGERFLDGTIADRNRIYFSEWYLKSLNSLYLKPLDFPYWDSLNSDIARRLYEYLSFVSFATKCKPFSIEYRKLCDLLPITPQAYLSKAKYCLKTAHQELMRTRFLKQVVWRKSTSKADSKPWILTYSFGPRARSELQRGFQDETYRPAILAVETADVPAIEEQVESEDGKCRGVTSTRKQHPTKEEKELSEIAQQLYDRGITRSVAIDLAESFPQEYLLEKMALHDDMKAAGELTTNAAGWLREAILQDFQLTEEQKRRREAQAKRREREAKEQALRAQAEAIQAQRIHGAMNNFPTKEEWVRQYVELRKQIRALLVEQFGRAPLTDAEIEHTRRMAIQEYPETEREKLAHIRHHPQDYGTDLDEIMKGLKAESPPTTP